LQVPVALNSVLHEKALAATASFFDASDLHAINPNPPAVTKVDPDGTAHVHYSFSGPGRKLFVCLGTARASLKVQFTIDQQLPQREPPN
jgi:hypothetical protein